MLCPLTEIDIKMRSEKKETILNVFRVIENGGNMAKKGIDTNSKCANIQMISYDQIWLAYMFWKKNFRKYDYFAGILKAKELPLGEFGSTHTDPWCASAIFLAIESPRPLPFDTAN